MGELTWQAALAGLLSELAELVKDGRALVRAETKRAEAEEAAARARVATTMGRGRG